MGWNHIQEVVSDQILVWIAPNTPIGFDCLWQLLKDAQKNRNLSIVSLAWPSVNRTKSSVDSQP